jgi:uncharacterized protein YciI
MKKILFFSIFLFSVSSITFAQNKNQETEKMQFIYRLKLIPKLLDENNWTGKETKIVDIHFNKLKELTEEGIVILAGRTLTMDEDGFGIVIFEAENEKEAVKIMNEDPAVKEGIMTAELFPYRVALIRDPYREN